jgi:hypothetical protein
MPVRAIDAGCGNVKYCQGETEGRFLGGFPIHCLAVYRPGPGRRGHEQAGSGRGLKRQQPLSGGKGQYRHAVGPR